MASNSNAVNLSLTADGSQAQKEIQRTGTVVDDFAKEVAKDSDKYQAEVRSMGQSTQKYEDQVKQSTISIEGSFKDSGKAAKDAAEKAQKAFDAASESLDTSEQSSQGLADSITGVQDTMSGFSAFAQGDFAGGLATAGAGVASFSGGIVDTLVPALKNAYTKFGALKFIIGGVVLGAAAVAGFVVFQQVMDNNAKKADSLSRSLKTLANTGIATGEFAREFGTGAQGVKKFGDEIGGATNQLDKLTRTAFSLGGLSSHLGLTNPRNAFWSKFIPQPDEIRDFERLDDALADSIKNGADSAQTLSQLENAYGRDNVQLALANNLLPKFKTAMDDATQATDAQASSVDSLTDDWKKALGTTKDYYDYLKGQTDPIFRFSQAQQAYDQAIKNTTDAEKEFGRNSDEYKQAVLDQAQAHLDLNDAAAGYSEVSPELLQSLGLTSAELDGVTTAGTEAAAAVNGIPNKKNIDIYFNVYGNGDYAAQVALSKALTGYYSDYGKHLAGVPGYASGGMVPGTPGEAVLATVHAGERISRISDTGTQQTIVVNTGGNLLMNYLVSELSAEIRARGGDVQLVLGNGS